MKIDWDIREILIVNKYDRRPGSAAKLGKHNILMNSRLKKTFLYTFPKFINVTVTNFPYNTLYPWNGMKYFFKWDFYMYRKSHGTSVSGRNEKKYDCAWRSAQLESEECKQSFISFFYTCILNVYFTWIDMFNMYLTVHVTSNIPHSCRSFIAKLNQVHYSFVLKLEDLKD